MYIFFIFTLIFWILSDFLLHLLVSPAPTDKEDKNSNLAECYKIASGAYDASDAPIVPKPEPRELDYYELIPIPFKLNWIYYTCSGVAFLVSFFWISRNNPMTSRAILSLLAAPFSYLYLVFIGIKYFILGDSLNKL